MNKILRKAIAPAMAVAIVAGCSVSASAWSIKDALGGSGLGETVGNVLEGVFTKSNLTLEDVTGEWITDGSAVSFKSDNLLQKAGGVAAAAAIETKINPYYEQLGLNNAVMTINSDGTFSLKAKLMTLQGTLTSNNDGTFEFNFKALGKIPLGKMTAYVQKSGNHLDIMFDATKLKSLISGIAKISGISLAKTAASLLDSYDGLCVGFGMNKSGTSVSSSGASQEDGSSSSKGNGAAGALFDLLKKGSGK